MPDPCIWSQIVQFCGKEPKAGKNVGCHHSSKQTLDHTRNCSAHSKNSLEFVNQFVPAQYFNNPKQTENFDHTVQTRQSNQSNELIVIPVRGSAILFDNLSTPGNVFKLFLLWQQVSYPLNWQNRGNVESEPRLNVNLSDLVNFCNYGAVFKIDGAYEVNENVN